MNYMKEKLDEIKFRDPKGQKSAIRKYAEKIGKEWCCNSFGLKICMSGQEQFTYRLY